MRLKSAGKTWRDTVFATEQEKGRAEMGQFLTSALPFFLPL